MRGVKRPRRSVTRSFVIQLNTIIISLRQTVSLEPVSNCRKHQIRTILTAATARRRPITNTIPISTHGLSNLLRRHDQGRQEGPVLRHKSRTKQCSFARSKERLYFRRKDKTERRSYETPEAGRRLVLELPTERVLRRQANGFIHSTSHRKIGSDDFSGPADKSHGTG